MAKDLQEDAFGPLLKVPGCGFPFRPMAQSELVFAGAGALCAAIPLGEGAERRAAGLAPAPFGFAASGGEWDGACSEVWVPGPAAMGSPGQCPAKMMENEGLWAEDWGREAVNFLGALACLEKVGFKDPQPGMACAADAMEAWRRAQIWRLDHSKRFSGWIGMGLQGALICKARKERRALGMAAAPAGAGPARRAGSV